MGQETEALDENSKEKVRVGTRIIKQLSTTFYPNPLIIFDELVANARDALASTVKIHIAKDQVTIEDDGEGMTRDGLVKFFYISHTEKNKVKVRTFKDVKRYIIGKFGIGKLSLYQICRLFQIETWRGGKMSIASFDFTQFELAEFVDKFELDVRSHDTDREGSGTKLTLLQLREDVDEVEVKRHLMKTMPLTQDFKIILSGKTFVHPITLESKYLVDGKAYELHDNIPGVGPVDGVAIYRRITSDEDYGVFVRIFDRLVNLDNPYNVVSFADLNHARQFDRRIYVEVNVNGLNDALQTNRTGFIVTDPKYKHFQEWIKKILNDLNEKEYQHTQAAQVEVERQHIPEAVSDAIIFAAKKVKTEVSHPALRIESKHARGHQKMDVAHVKHAEKKQDILELAREGKLSIQVEALGYDEEEAVFDVGKRTLLINTDSPSYQFARTQGKLPGVAYHMFKTTVLYIALESSSTLSEFRKTYNDLIRDPDIFGDYLIKRWGKILK